MTKETCVGEMVILHLDHAEVESREWQRHDFHFDNVIDAFLSLFTFSTGAGWPDGMWASIESTQELVHSVNLYNYARAKLRRDETETLDSFCDWLALSDTIFDWPRVPSW